MDKNQLLLALQKEVEGFNKAISTEKGDWIVKGFIDIHKNIYTITIDTKVVSKIMEILLILHFINLPRTIILSSNCLKNKIVIQT